VKNLVAKTLFIASVASYICSLCVPAFYDTKGPWFGYAPLMLGVIGLFGRYYCWLANPVILMVWIAALLKRPVLVICGAILACALCLSFLSHHMIDHEEGQAQIIGLGSGFWLWLVAPLLMIFHGLLTLKKQQNPNAN
jgi:hypothetical protein